MKDSKIKYIGLIPDNWKTQKIKYVCDLYVGNSIADNLKENYEDADNAYPYISTKDINVDNSLINYENGMYTKKDDDSFRLAPKKSTLLCIEGGSAGKKIAQTEQIVSFVNKLCCFNAKKINADFLYMYLKSSAFNEEFNQYISGLIGGVTQTKLKTFHITLPPKEEQKLIADFLDKKVGEIDNILSDFNNQVNILEKYKKSLITETVTKGLNPDVEMKNSGIEWIGQIPAHWNFKKLKYIISSPLLYGANESGEDYDETLPRYIRITDIDQNNNLKEDGKLSLPSELAEPYMLKDGDILFARSGATVGKTFFYRSKYGPSAFAGYLIKASISDKIALPKYIYYTTLGTGYENWKNSIFTQSTIQNIGADKYSLYVVPIPNIDEQKEIVKFLDKKCKEIDDIIKDKQMQIEKIEKYKKSLIYEYVTGKKRVKGVE